jgi:hypothetical protein
MAGGGQPNTLAIYTNRAFAASDVYLEANWNVRAPFTTDRDSNAVVTIPEHGMWRSSFGQCQLAL